MATQKEIHELIGRAAYDEEFRKKLMTDPEGTVKELGSDLTQEQLSAIKGMEGKGLAAVLDESLPKLALPL
jgi:hypothetical protein